MFSTILSTATHVHMRNTSVPACPRSALTLQDVYTELNIQIQEGSFTASTFLLREKGVLYIFFFFINFHKLQADLLELEKHLLFISPLSCGCNG